PVLVRHRDEHVHQLYINFESGVRFLRITRQANGGTGEQQQTSNTSLSHREAGHLDARLIAGVPWARGISAGNGSPSAQTTPSSKYSFFQIGTVRLRVSISQRQASKAAARCADATTISTLISPISSLPRRWTMATSRIGKRESACSLSSSICFTAMSS